MRVEIPELGVSQEIAAGPDGVFAGEVRAPRLVRWTPERPRLYDVAITAGGDRVTDRVGFRTIATRGGQILLNGQPVFLRGISIHEENPMRGGRAYSPEDARLLLGWAKELGCNFVRLAHYPHSEHMARVADELGLMVWEEIPVYWTIAWENPDTLQNAQNQLTEMIERDANRASVIVWSVANETPVSEPRTRFLEALVARARSLDPTRLVSAAMEVTRDPADPDARIVDDPFGATTDLASFNQYVGWYDGLPDRLARVKWTVRSDKPVVVTEFGADALQGLHADDRTRFSEEYQETLYRETIAMLRKIPNWSGLTPWILADFRSPRRALPGIQDGWNRKGLIGQNGTRKKAFFVLQQFYAEKASREALSAGGPGAAQPRPTADDDQHARGTRPAVLPQAQLARQDGDRVAGREVEPLGAERQRDLALEHERELLGRVGRRVLAAAPAGLERDQHRLQAPVARHRREGRHRCRGPGAREDRALPRAHDGAGDASRRRREELAQRDAQRSGDALHRRDRRRDLAVLDLRDEARREVRPLGERAQRQPGRGPELAHVQADGLLLEERPPDGRAPFVATGH